MVDPAQPGSGHGGGDRGEPGALLNHTFGRQQGEGAHEFDGQQRSPVRRSIGAEGLKIEVIHGVLVPLVVQWSIDELVLNSWWSLQESNLRHVLFARRSALELDGAV